MKGKKIVVEGYHTSIFSPDLCMEHAKFMVVYKNKPDITYKKVKVTIEEIKE